MFRVLIYLLASPAAAVSAPSKNVSMLEIRSADGTRLNAQVDLTAKKALGTVVFVSGTGGFDRDAKFGRSGTSRDLLFKDLVGRMNALGLQTLRYDLRGIRHGVPAAETLDRRLLATRTTTTMRDDLAAIYGWARAQSGRQGRCVIFFAHSEGMIHVARLAASGAPAPRMIIGMGAAMESPRAVFHWQSTERDAYSLGLMDSNRDGRITNAEVRTNWMNTPSAVFGMLQPFEHPEGSWSQADLTTLRSNQERIYGTGKAEVIAKSDAAPYPDAKNAFASYQWWKSWYLDDVSSALRLARWKSPLILHYGDKDSQTNAARQLAAVGLGCRGSSGA